MAVVVNHINCIIPNPSECYVRFMENISNNIQKGIINADTQITIVDKIIFLALVKELTTEYYRKHIITEVVESLETIKTKGIINIIPYVDTIDIKKLIQNIKNTKYTIGELLCYIQTIINMYSLRE